MKYKHYLKILKKRENALRLGHLIRTPDDYVPAFINYKNKSHPVKLRLKGDLGSHWEGDKWSFRVKMNKKDSDNSNNKDPLILDLNVEEIKKTIAGEAMDDLGLTRICCRKTMLSSIELINEI